MRVTLTNDAFKLSLDNKTLSIAIHAYDEKIDVSSLTQVFKGSPYKNFKLSQSSLNDVVEKTLALTELNNTPESIQYIPIAERIDATHHLEIDDDKMNVKAILTSAYDGKIISANDLILSIKELGIKKGINKKIIKLLLTKSQNASPGASFSATIASGTPPIHSINATLKCHVETAKDRILKPATKENGKVDMRDLGQLLMVKSNQLLMEKIPIVEGTDGITVTGIIIPFNKGKDITLKQGANTHINNENENQLLATLSGIPKKANNGMSVDEVLFVNSVDATSGHVDYEGSIIISGDVSEGMKVKASGDITIAGFVQSADIQCGGDLIVEKGIIGLKKQDNAALSCLVQSEGSVIANFSQYSSINCKEDLIIQTQLVHCDVACSGNIEVHNESKNKGTIFGGNIATEGRICTAILGTEAGGKTNIEITGAHTQLMNEKDTMTTALNEQKFKLKNLFVAQRKLDSLPESEQKQILDFRLVETKENIKTQIANLDSALNTNKYNLQECKETNQVIVTQKLQQGVTISISDEKYRSDQSYGPTEVSIVKGKIQRLPYKK